MNPGPAISVIAAVRDVGSAMGPTIDSLVCQSFDGWELIVVDGGSADDTLARLEPYRHRIATLISEPDSGIAEAWNKGLRHCRGDWVLFLGAGDRLWDPDVFADMVPVLASLPGDVRVCYGRVAVTDAAGHVTEMLGVPWERARGGLALAMPIPHQGTFHRRSLFDDVGGFDQTVRIAVDYEFMLRELRWRPPVFADRVIASFAEGGISTRPDKRLSVVTDYRRVRRKHGLPSAPGFLDAKALIMVIMHALLGRRFRRLRRLVRMGRRQAQDG